MKCISCGTTILPDMMYCPGCGTPAAYSAPAQLGTQPQNFYNTDTQQETLVTNAGTQIGPQTPNTGAPPYGYNTGQPQNPPSQQYPPTQQYPPPMQTPPPQPSKRKRGLSRGLTITVIVLVLLVLVGSGTIYYFSVPYPAQLHAQATATVQSRLNNQATGTALSIHNDNATATAQAQATLTAQQNIYTQATTGTPAITDSLTQNGGLRWDQYDIPNSRSCVYAGSMYHVKELQSGFIQTCYAQASNFSNFTLQVQMTILSGDFGGFIFRSNANGSKFYLLQFNSDGSYQMYGYVNSNGTNSRNLLSSTTTAMKGLIQPNLFTLIARGSQFTVFVNKQYVDTVTDDLYKGGLIGLAAYYKSSPTEVAYSNLQIWKL